MKIGRAPFPIKLDNLSENRLSDSLMLVFGQHRHSPGAWLMPIVTVSEEVHAIIVVRQPGLLHLAKPIRRLTAREFSWAAAFFSERDHAYNQAPI
jgi:hypothetical protein